MIAYLPRAGVVCPVKIIHPYTMPSAGIGMKNAIPMLDPFTLKSGNDDKTGCISQIIYI